MQRLLCIVSSMDRGGAETFLMKVYRSLDKKKYQMDFCVSNPKKGFYDDEIKSMGGKIFIVTPKSKNPFNSFFDIVRIVKREQYKSVLRTSQQSLASLDLLAAKIGGAEKLIYRSSNAGVTGGFFSKFVNKLFCFLPRIVPNVKIAPSSEAAEFVFGKRNVQNNKVTILKNGLDYDKFEFSESIRKKIREDLGLQKNIIYGHVGRFNIQKNHIFLLEIFQKISQKDKNACLILIGEGELEHSIEEKISELNLESNVKILGPKSNVNEYLMAMDFMIFPSYFEGMPNVIIEAQATGLKCLISDSITKEVNFTDLIEFKSLNESADDWADMALKSIFYKRITYKNKFLENGYCIEAVVKKFINIVFM